MKPFFPMRKSEALILVFLIVMAVISFLPIWRTMEIGGMAVFGWLLAALMIAAPLLTLFVFRRNDRAKGGKIRNDKAGIDDIESGSRSLSSEADPEP